MGFRTVVVSTHSKLELSLNYLVFKTPDEVKRINGAVTFEDAYRFQNE